MLSHMGLKCVQGYGEAEAMCAYLNADGIVDGCVSQDNDCFLYGARVVYRNFNVSGAAASGGSIDVYRMEKTENSLNLDRNKMVALALLCGCDYDDGLNGVGREAALKLFAHVHDQDILDRLRSWKTDKKFDRIEAQLANSKLCTSCGHQGNVRVHARTGCVDCFTAKSCSDDYKEKRKMMLNEITLRKKALLHDGFPDQEIIDEYLVRKGPVPSSLDLKWQQPNLVKFIFFMEKKLGWEPDYSFEKFLPLITRWQLISLPEITLKKSISFMKYSVGLPVTRLLFPDRIKKIRNIKSVASYEIIWTDSEGYLEGLVTLSAVKSIEEDEISEKPDSDERNTTEEPLATIEPQNLVVNCYPELVEMFEEDKAAKKKSKNPKPRAKTKKNENSSEVESGSNTEKTKKPAAKRERRKLVDVVNTRKIDDYISKNAAAVLEDSFSKLEITPKRLKRLPQIESIKRAEVVSKLNNTLDRMFENLTVDDFAGEDEGEFDMSEIIEEICGEKKQDRFISVSVNEGGCNRSEKNTSEELVTPASHEAQRPHDAFNNQTNKVEPCEAEMHNETDEFADIENYVPLSERVTSLKQTL